MHLAAGEAAPFAGQLMPVERIIKLGQKAERCEFLLEQETTRLTRLFEIDLQLERNKLVIELERGELRESAYRLQLDRSWLEHPVFVAVVTMVATYAILYGARELDRAAQ